VGDGLSRQTESFASRFEPGGDDYLVRSHGRAPAIWLTAAERDRLVQAYDRSIGWTSWIAAGLILPAIAAVGSLLARITAPLPVWADFAAMAPCVAIYFGPVYWLWRAPTALCGDARPRRQAGRGRRPGRRLWQGGKAPEGIRPRRPGGG